MSKVTLKGFITVPPEDLNGVLDELPNHIALTEQEPGCLVFKVIQDADEQCRFTVYEEFDNKASFEAHQSRVRSSKWSQITGNVTRHYTIEGAQV